MLPRPFGSFLRPRAGEDPEAHRGRSSHDGRSNWVPACAGMAVGKSPLTLRSAGRGHAIAFPPPVLECRPMARLPPVKRLFAAASAALLLWVQPAAAQSILRDAETESL